MANKLTKKDLFNKLLEVEEISANEELVGFINHELELLEKKANRTGTTKTQKENEGIKDIIFETLRLEGAPMTITQLQETDKTLEGLSNQKISALLAQLVNTNKVIRTKDKKTTLFAYNDEQR